MNWYSVRAIVIGVLIGVGILVVFNLIASYLTQGKVTLVPKVEYRDRVVYASNPCPTPSVEIPFEVPSLVSPSRQPLRAVQVPTAPSNPLQNVLPNVLPVVPPTVVPNLEINFP